MSLSRTVFLLLHLITLWVGGALGAQSTQLFFKQFTTDDGLPSSETYCTFEDRDGFLWVGTDNGIAKFDGYEFLVYDADDGLEDSVVFNIHQDVEGRIWVSTISGRVFYLEGDRFRPYKYNDIVIGLKGDQPFVNLIDVTPDAKLVFAIHLYGNMFEIDQEGVVKTLCTPEDQNIYVYPPYGGRPDDDRQAAHNYCYYKYTSDELIAINLFDGEEWNDLGQIAVDKRFGPIYAGVFNRQGEPETVVALHGKLHSSIDNFRRVIPLNADNYAINFALPAEEEDGYWLFLSHGGGLRYYQYDPETHHTTYLQYLDGHSLSSGWFDRKGGFWITSLDAGLFYVPSPRQRIYLKEDPQENAKPTALAAYAIGSFYAGYDDGSLFIYSRGVSQMSFVDRPDKRVRFKLGDLFFDHEKQRLYSALQYYDSSEMIPGQSRNSQSGANNYFESPYKTPSYGFKKFNNNPYCKPEQLFALGLSWMQIFELGQLDSSYTKQNIQYPSVVNPEVVGYNSAGEVILGAIDGLYQQTNSGKWKHLKSEIPALNGRIVDFQSLANGAMVYATRGNGLVYVSSDTSYTVGEAEGLASDMVRSIHQNDSGVIWAATLNGVSKVSFTDTSTVLRTFRRENGLPSNEVYQIDTYGDEIWMATSAGIVEFSETPVDTVSAAPVIRRLLVNGQSYPTSRNFVLPAGKHDVSISFGTINYLLGQNVNYRFRLNSDATWQYTNERTANYPNLGEGTYNFAVQSQNQDGIWSSVTTLDFTVATPLQNTWYARLSVILLLLAILSAYFLVRERRRRREHDLLLQINQLEHAALHAQMNPHFVFNALNSIQNFVLKNDPKQAAIYLSRFALVVRQTLRSSVKGQHALADEISMLTTYLLLEKLRFKEGFSYQITLAPDLDQQNIVLPPLLIQPFVENAIIHGLAGKVEEGIINVSFRGNPQLLEVEIEDNGSGFATEQEPDEESMGMDITRRRLEMMKGKNRKVSGMKIEPLYNTKGKPRGTKVVLWIYLDNVSKARAVNN